ncbi:acyltransferase family protein [Marinobacter sp. M216]|uniref:Acyltransferase family protein n=1 Tax=Marinobacter albus TaxID=3030833 RepID=A0ABT7H878_9GAMM|nr:acyltransferase family protein [Marinobacter sp. M216]MDK9556562.1 acyltransferase family protein [Marinobacter sp. M216]
MHRTQKTQLVPYIQGLRGVAIIAVVLAHAGFEFFEAGFIGVDIFFVLSGYLITGLLVREIDKTGSIDFLGFYARRLKRLFPALALMILVVSAFLLTFMSPLYQAEQHGAALSAIAWVSNLYFAFSSSNYFSPNQEENVFLHTWSLGVEEQFYLFWPFWVMFAIGGFWAGKEGNRSKRRLFIVLVLTAIFGFCFSAVVTFLHPEWGFYLPISRVWQFAAGGVAFVGVANGQRYFPHEMRAQKRLLLSSVAWCGFFLLICSFGVIDQSKTYPGWWALFPTLGSAFLLFSLALLKSHPIDCWLRYRPVQFVGDISYSLYLWHWPVLVIGKLIFPGGGAAYLLALLLLAGLLALASHFLVENPIRYHERLSSKNREVLAGSTVFLLAFLTLGGVWGVVISEWRDSGTIVEFEKSLGDLPKIYAMECDPPVQSDEVEVCSFGTQQAEKTAVLLGDSVAAQWFPTFESIFTDAGWRFLVITKSACPMVDQNHVYYRIKREYTECASWRRKALKYLKGVSPDLVLTSSSRTYPFSKDDWRDAGGRIQQELSETSTNLVVIAPTPLLGSSGPRCLARYSALSEAFANDCSVSLSSQNPIDEVLKDSIEDIPNAYFMDFNSVICPNGLCKPLQGTNIVYRDHLHLTASYARFLQTEARQFLSSLAIEGLSDVIRTQ